MLEFVSSLPFLIIVAVFAVFFVIGIAKRAVRLLLWTSIIFVILICLGVVKRSELLNWFESLFKIVE